MHKIINILGTGEKQWGCELLPYKFSSRNKTNKQTNKQANKQNQRNLLTLTVSFEKIVVNEKQKEAKQKTKRTKRRITKLIKKIMEEMIVMKIITAMKIVNNSESGYLEKKYL